jgi:hypothetical protein
VRGKPCCPSDSPFTLQPDADEEDDEGGARGHGRGLRSLRRGDVGRARRRNENSRGDADEANEPGATDRVRIRFRITLVDP